MSRNCIVGTILGDASSDGVIPTPEQEKMINSDPHIAANYARGLHKNDVAIQNETQMSPTSMKLQEAGKTANAVFTDLARIALRPEDILDQNVVLEVKALAEKFSEMYPKGNYSDWKREFAPAVDKIIEKYQDVINVDPKKAMYYNDYLNKYVRVGGDLFGQYQYPSLVGRAINAATEGPMGALISNNPAIAAFNLFEMSPKSIAWATMHSGNNPVAGFNSFLRALGKVAIESKGKPWKRIEALNQQGIYGDFNTSSNPLLKRFQENTGIADVIDITENPFRGLLYYLGEDLLGAGGGLKALEENAFVYQWWNKPFYLQGANNKSLIGLSRFTVGSTTAVFKMFNYAYQGVKAGDPTAALPIVSFALMQALQTGSTSVIPAYFWPVLPDEAKEQLREIDKQFPINIVGKLTGQDYSEYTRLGAISLGLPTQVAEAAIKGGLGGLKSIAQGIATQNPEQILAGAALTTSIYASLGTSGGEIGKLVVPYWAGNYNIQKLLRQWARVTSGEIERESFGTEYLKALKLAPGEVKQ